MPSQSNSVPNRHMTHHHNRNHFSPLQPELVSSIQKTSSNSRIVPPLQWPDLPIGSTPRLFHSTDTHFTDFHDNPTWFSVDPLDGFRLVLYNLDVEIGRGTRLGDRQIYVHRCEAVAKLNLFEMAANEHESIDRLKSQWGMDINKTPRRQWYGKTANEARHFVEDFCLYAGEKQVDGWRNNWDQNEVMLCHPQSVTCSGGWTCDAGKLVEEVSDHGQYQMHAEQQTDTGRDNRFSFFILKRSMQVSSSVSFDEYSKNDVAAELFKSHCQEDDSLFIDGSGQPAIAAIKLPYPSPPNAGLFGNV